MNRPYCVLSQKFDKIEVRIEPHMKGESRVTSDSNVHSDYSASNRLSNLKSYGNTCTFGFTSKNSLVTYWVAKASPLGSFDWQSAFRLEDDIVDLMRAHEWIESGCEHPLTKDEFWLLVKREAKPLGVEPKKINPDGEEGY